MGKKRQFLCYLWDIKASSGTAFMLPISVSPLEISKTEVGARLQMWEGYARITCHLQSSNINAVESAYLWNQCRKVDTCEMGWVVAFKKLA